MSQNLSEAYFEQLAIKDPHQLIKTLTTKEMSFGLLARGLKVFASCSDHDLTASFLISYLNHDQPMIQEGALLGLWPHRIPKVLEAVKSMVFENTIIQEMIQEFLENEF
jgi:hypothetical protein